MMRTLLLTEKEMHIGNLILINAKFPHVSSLSKKLISADKEYTSVLMEREAATVLSYILRDMNCKNEIVPISGYRTNEEQRKIYLNSLNENGKEFTNKYVALPNHSEHESGLAIDLGLNKENIDFIRPEFPYEGVCNRFREMAHNFGFIERYQKEKESITGIAHEPWHFRYVGYPHSKIMHENSLSLEEYIEFLKKFTYLGEHLITRRGRQKIEIFYVSNDISKEMILNISEQSLYQVSGNNADGYIITMWR